MSSAVYTSLPPYIGDDRLNGGTTTNGGALLRIKSRTTAMFATRRPWRELFAHPSSYSVPSTVAEFADRFRGNLSHFRVNYAMVVLLVLFVSLVYHPTAMIVFIALFVLWFLLYFFRDEPIVVFNRTVDDRHVLIGLGVVTVVGLVLAGVWINVLVAVVVGGVAVVLHVSFRLTEDLFLDEDEISVVAGGGGGLRSVVGTRF